MNGLIEGKKYVLSTPVDTVITDVKYNIPLGTVKAGQQFVFQAVSDAVTVADGCTIRPFEGSNGASVGVVGGGGEGGSLPEIYMSFGKNGSIEAIELTKLEQFNGTISWSSYALDYPFPNLKSAKNMFNTAGLNVIGSLTKDDAGNSYFYYSLPELENAESMFYNNVGIGYSWNDANKLVLHLPKLTNGKKMFYAITSTYWQVYYTLEILGNKLENGEEMFEYCNKLRKLQIDLSSLTNGKNMFGSVSYRATSLDLESVQNIAETINDLASKGLTGQISIGMLASIQSDDETAPINVALAAIRAKGWTVTEIYRS